jgi:hypothetical protein
MIEAGAIGARFTVVDEASSVLERIAAQFESLDGIIRQVKEAMASIAMPPETSAALKTMNEQMVAIGGAADKGATQAALAFGSIDASIEGTAGRLAGLKTEMASVGKINAEVAAMMPAAAGGTGGRVPPGLRARGTGGHGDDPHLRAAPVALPGGVHVSGGFWETIGVAAGLDAWKHILDAGGELQTQQKLLHDLLGSREQPGDVAAATNLAIKYATDAKTGIIGSTPAENLAGSREIYPFMPDLKAAEQSLPALMQSAKLLEEMTGGKSKAVDQLPILAKAIENLGGGINPETHELDPLRVQQAINEATKTIIAGGGVIDANALFGFAKQAGGMGRIDTDLGHLFDGIVTSILDMGGPRARTALAALGRQFLATR